MMLDTVRYVSRTPASGIKLQLLHILKNTDLAEYYARTGFPVLSMEEYVDLVVRCLEVCRPDLVIHRLTGDGPSDLLTAPLWSQAKRTVTQCHPPGTETAEYLAGAALSALRPAGKENCHGRCLYPVQTHHPLHAGQGGFSLEQCPAFGIHPGSGIHGLLYNSGPPSLSWMKPVF